MGKLAALSSGLLARKGQAKPAMRPQSFAVAPATLDDLGWNDMGAPAPAPELPPVLPPVLIARAELEAQIEPVAAPAPAPALAPEAPAPAPAPRRAVSVATAQRIRRETGKAAQTGKAAFTLRLDAERHLRLRLASAVTGRSSQALVTAALDQFLQTLPEVETLVQQLPPAKRR